jgi:hypothetical protein
MAKSTEQKEFEEKEYSQWYETNKDHLSKFLSENLEIEVDINTVNNFYNDYSRYVRVKILLNEEVISMCEDCIGD